jgi:hypothetical protein
VLGPYNATSNCEVVSDRYLVLFLRPDRKHTSLSVETQSTCTFVSWVRRPLRGPLTMGPQPRRTREQVAASRLEAAAGARANRQQSLPPEQNHTSERLLGEALTLVSGHCDIA